MAPLDVLGGWECPASGDGLEPCDGRKRPSLQSCAMGPQSPAPHPLSGSCFLALVSLRPSLLVPCGNLGDTLPPSSALGEAPHPQGPYTHQTSQIAPCGNFVLCSDKLCVMILQQQKHLRKECLFPLARCAMQPGSRCPWEGTKINQMHSAGGTSTKGLCGQEAI